MFWRFNYLSSEIDTLLDKEDVTLLEIISEEDVLQECKAQNNKLVDYLTRPESMKDLIEMVITEPSSEVEEKMRYKFPNISCELVTSDVNAITDALINTPQLLDTLLSFLDKEETLNPLQASFFSKVVGLLITRRSQSILDYLKSRENFLERVLHHLETSAIMDLLLRLVISLETHQLKIECLQWLRDQGLIKSLIDLLRPSNNPDCHYNAALSLCDLIKHGRDQVSFEQENNSGEILFEVIQSEESVSALLENIFEDSSIESSLLSGLSVLQTLVEFKKVSSSEGPFDSVSSTLPDVDKFMAGVEGALRALTPRLKDFHAILAQPPKQHFCPMPTTTGVIDLPFGNSRLQVARLFNSLLMLNYNPINQELQTLGSIGVLLDLFFEYSWNNFLHTQFEHIVSTILTNSTCTETTTTTPLKNRPQLISQLLVEFKILERIMEAFATNEDRTKLGGHRLGYMGHLTKIANAFSAQKVKELAEDLPESTFEKWTEFVASALAEVNKVNAIDGIGGSTPGLGSISGDFELRLEPDEKGGRIMRLFGFIEDGPLESDDISIDTYNWSNLSPKESSDESNSKSLKMFEDFCSERNDGDDNAIQADEEVWEEKLANFPESLLKPDLLEKMKSPKENDDLKLQNSPNIEEMEVSTNDDWNKSDDLPMDDAPSTVSWSASPPTKPSVENWADFTHLEEEEERKFNHAPNSSDVRSDETNLLSGMPKFQKCDSPGEPSLPSTGTNSDGSRSGETELG